MADEIDYFAKARNIAVEMLRGQKERTMEQLQTAAHKAAEAVRLFAPNANVDATRLTAELRHLFSVGVESGTVLDDNVDHIPWLLSRKGSTDWRFWNRYLDYLQLEFVMPPAVVANLDRLTDMILERIEDPRRSGRWDRRGMVVGSVQSGKTANYTGLICKALDAGYKLVIVLAGIHSSLRAQTQLRLDEGVLGFDTQKSRRLEANSRWIGVGKFPGERPVVHSLTSSAEAGDFNKSIAEQIGVMLGGDPVILVVKKNTRLLENLTKWVVHVAGGKGDLIEDIPLLLIDDEADNASINTRQNPGEVTAINGRIRRLLNAFGRSAYVGYTATPFANIFINPDSELPDYGADLFPRSFIVNIRPPDDYVGPVKVFGLDGDTDAGIESSDGLPIVRTIDDYGEAFPPRHKKTNRPTELPHSLVNALRCFLLTCAARRARGQAKAHNSMLIHVTRFVEVQARVAELVQEELNTLQRRLQFGDGARKLTIEEDFRRLWLDEYAPVTESLASSSDKSITWDEIRSQLYPAASKAVVVVINGFAKEVLDYKQHEADGFTVIAIGGDKLSRGLTLEGLSISYFLRASQMYDTLLQMGRWFGYRRGFLDLCRLYTTATLVDWYRHLALAEEELRREFDYMVAAGLTPLNYGLRVRTHPEGMIVTAMNKMSHATTLELSWAGVLAQTSRLPKQPARISENYRATERFVDQLGQPEPHKAGATRQWVNVHGQAVAEYVDMLRYPPASARASGAQLAAFIRKQITKVPAELISWTVALLSNAQAEQRLRRTMAGADLGLIERTPESQDTTSIGLTKANILSPADESRDFEGKFDQSWFAKLAGKRDLQDDIAWLESKIGESAQSVALELTMRWLQTDPPKIRSGKSPTRANGRVIRSLRPQENGLLLIYPIAPPAMVPSDADAPTGLDPAGKPLIGVVLSFPTSSTTLGIEYKVNTIWGAEMEDDAWYDD